MTVHDYSVRFFGHDYVINKVYGEGEEIDLIGWGPGLHQEDFIILQNRGRNNTTQYKLTDVDYYHDPPDMWRARARFAPRLVSAK